VQSHHVMAGREDAKYVKEDTQKHNKVCMIMQCVLLCIQ